MKKKKLYQTEEYKLNNVCSNTNEQKIANNRGV